MPRTPQNRKIRLDWAIYLHELEKKVFQEARLKTQASADSLSDDPLPPLPDIEFQQLLNKTKHKQWMEREQAARKLAGCQHPVCCQVLIQLLKDENYAVSRAAIHSLVAQRRAAVRPLLEEITRDFQSTCFLKAARHVLRALEQSGELTGEEIRVLNSLHNIRAGLQTAQIANEVLIQSQSLVA